MKAPGVALMIVGFLSLHLFPDQGERYEWFGSTFIMSLDTLAAVSLASWWASSFGTSPKFTEFP